MKPNCICGESREAHEPDGAGFGHSTARRTAEGHIPAEGKAAMTVTTASTPGPWCVMGRESATEGWKDLAVCQETMPFNRICFLTSDGPAEANGRLIAAAPDLLALAKHYASECAECDGTGREPYTDEVRECEECRDIRLVIAKAEGR